MLLPLICVVIALSSLRFYMEGGEIAGHWTGPLKIWGFYLISIYLLSHHFLKRVSIDAQPYLSGGLYLITLSIFIYLLPEGLYWADICLKHAHDYLSQFQIKSAPWSLWQWIAIFPYLLAMLIIMSRPTFEGGRPNFKSSLRFMILILLPYFFGSVLLETALWEAVSLALFDKIPDWDHWFSTYGLEWPLACFVITILVVLLPSIAMKMISSQALPKGSIRKELCDQASLAGIGYRDIKVWQAGSNQVNAAVMGTVPSLRYLLITPAMLDRFSLEEIRLVFWHEFGHIKYKHLWIHYLFFMTVPGLPMVLGDMYQIDTSSIEASVGVLIFWAIAFSWISRNLEKQADLFALKHSQSNEDYLNVLYHLGSATGLSPKFISLTHGSLNQRINFLKKMSQKPLYNNYFDRRIKWLSYLLIVLFITIWAWWFIRFVIS